MCGNPRETDPYLPTPFQESNAILLAGLVVNEPDGETAAEAETRLEDLIREMSPRELGNLAAAAQHLHDQCRAAARLMRGAGRG